MIKVVIARHKVPKQSHLIDIVMTSEAKQSLAMNPSMLKQVTPVKF